MSYFKRIRDIAAATIFGFVTMCSPAMYEAAHADLKGIELTSDTPLPMYHVSSSTLNLQSNTTLQGIPDLTQDLVAGNVYTCHAHLVGSSDTSTTIGGIKVALAATNGLTASPVESSTIVYNSTAAVANNAATALGNMVSFTGRYTDIILDASFSATHSGTIQLQAAQVASDVTITSVGQGSTFNCIHTPGTIAQAIQQGTPPMAAPFSGGASPNGNNYATGCNNGSCLAAEDVFQATTLSTAWNPYFASGAAGAAAPTGPQNFVMAAPITPNSANSSNLNYQTGCGGSPGAASSNFANHSCLMFDDHWTTTPTGTTPITALNLNNWYAGLMRCNGGFGGNANCTAQTTGSINYPWTSWCYANFSGCQASIYIDFPLAYNANNFGITHNPLTLASDGSLQMQQKFYSNGTAVADSSCVIISSSTDCTQINWIGATITTGGLATPGGGNNAPTNSNALIPATGGMMQYRLKQDIGLNSGVWGGVECDGIDGTNGLNSNPNLNANFEFGYTNGGATTGVQGIGYAVNNTANQPLNTVITTGDDGIGSGDMRNWHTIAIEWTGNATHQWNWYVDGVPQTIGNTWNSHNEPNTASGGFTCALTEMMALSAESSFHSQFDKNNPGGPFNIWISDVQIYKKPGT